MKNLNVALVRLVQFVVFVLFTFIVLVYFGTMILLPLDIVVLITKLLGVLGIGSLFGAVVAVPLVAYLGKIVYSTPGLIKLVVDNGIELANAGKQRVEAFNDIAAAVK
ncbi:hypothetical protein ACQE3E_08325 [Methylomonas sp. MED-D]|uniref:Uncharacterized protein n=1 Tax=Methylomonas koyamae TaxID=702114 RepID=A0A177NCC5_9GAMM|nr:MULTISPECIES: hypothetical protein [Methylomonas]NJA07434.1 hypothetical protein [Methylococcaceae bacterium WWC4]MDT4329090.1 hypothetical protein [Methylomonas sp. MV1]OAI15667.1 hypothetical protein A1355_00540 [Methylomonas koyamae]OHX36437.1 hypothetical protein BJL95_16675 [Methylomonas sp. LWB]WGS87708.1 hypothetical protein QC632_08100 [Methylomonas sp. UP202]